MYWRIFLSFWLALALILIGTVTVVVNSEIQREFSQPWVQRAELYAQATQAFESGGAQALHQWLQTLRPPEVAAQTFVVDTLGREMLGRSVPDFLRDPPARGVGGGRVMLPIRPVGGPLVLVGADGKTFHVIVGPLRSGPRMFGELEMPSVSTATLLIALVVSAGVCFFLARYLVAPVDELRRATREIAAGHLDMKVSPALKGRRDELGLLASDLDTMSERVRNLLESKQRLLRDVSHELRSPLTRLQLALSLARREEQGVERHLTRIACEADRLEQLIARTLRLASLERPLQGLEHVPVDLGELLANITADVAIEADAYGCKVRLAGGPGMQISGDPELLRSALENVIRNAVRYSPAGGLVSIHARLSAHSIDIDVHDEGPGVPDKDLQLIFEPFYRVDEARNRAVGGEGLGLAIAARAVAIHGGTIEASNLSPEGLAVCIHLPRTTQAAQEPKPSELVSAERINAATAAAADPALGQDLPA